MTIDKILISDFARATERAAYGASLYKGKNDKIAADQAAVDEMRKQLNTIKMKGRIVIGEGELDEAPMLYVNEEVGTKTGEEFDIAVDPLEGTNFTAKNLPNALSVLSVTRKGNLLQAPDIYMEKIAIGPGLPENLIDLDFGVRKNIELLAEAKNTTPDKLSACILKRQRHDLIVESLNSVGVIGSDNSIYKDIHSKEIDSRNGISYVAYEYSNEKEMNGAEVYKGVQGSLNNNEQYLDLNSVEYKKNYAI